MYDMPTHARIEIYEARIKTLNILYRNEVANNTKIGEQFVCYTTKHGLLKPLYQVGDKLYMGDYTTAPYRFSREDILSKDYPKDCVYMDYMAWLRTAIAEFSIKLDELKK